MKTLINDGWLFAKMPEGSTLADAKKAIFQPVDLPHDWLISQDDLYETADAWYVRELNIPSDPEKPVNILYFDGAYMDCDVLLNDEIISTHPYGYTAFTADITGKIKADGNRLMVHIRHKSPNTRWYSGSGIYRDVTLLTLPADHLVPDGLAVKTERKDNGWLISLSAETAGAEGVPFQCELLNREGETSAYAQGMSQMGFIQAKLVMPNGRPWSPEDPYLYELKITYKKQTEVRRIGLRSVFMDPDRGLFLNGRHIKLHGVCLHHDLGALGAAYQPKAAKRQLNLMREMGCNAVRTSHNPPAADFLDLCDDMGLLVVDEAFDMWRRSKTEYDYARFFDEWAERDVAAWVRRDRCHPSVIMWSIGNEIYDIHADPDGAKTTALLAGFVRRHDPARHAAVTFGCNYMPWEGGQRCAEFVDAVGYNYGEKLYEQHHTAHPEWKIYGSETGSVLSSRGIYHFPIEKSIMSEADRQCSALGNSNTSWGAEDLKKMIIEDLHTPYSMGQFIWSGIDYIGEPTPYHTRSCYFGQADTACFPKDSYFLFQSLWKERKMLHIGVSWDWNPGQMIDVPVMTNCAEAELFINGRSAGKKRTDRDNPDKCMPVWKIPFEAGTLLALGYDSKGEVLCEDRKVTPGETDHFVMRTEDAFLMGDGRDITFVVIAAEDQNGNPVENARDYVTVNVAGGGCLMGTDNGDPTDPDSYKSGCRRLFSGKLLLIIGSTGEPEDVSVRIKGNRGRDAELRIPVRKAERAAGVSRLQRIESNKMVKDTVPIRKICLRAEQPVILTKEKPECSFAYDILPPDATNRSIRFEVTNEAGIRAPFVNVITAENRVIVRAESDGFYYLRAMCGEREGETDVISQIEFSATGIGTPALGAYEYISAGLYDISAGDIGTGNEKGIAFSREGSSMAGFSRIDFGQTGTDRVTADIFALNGDPYEIEMFDGDPENGGKLLRVLRYQKPSIWNVYQAETWRLPTRLTGIRTICFRMNDKIHMKGFVFEKQQRAFLNLPAAGADSISGDSYTVERDWVTGIGNNVVLTWENMDFGRSGVMNLEIRGKTNLPVNTISVRIRSKEGAETTDIAEFRGGEGDVQQFRIAVPDGLCTVSFVFLPGSSFDFQSFRFYE